MRWCFFVSKLEFRDVVVSKASSALHSVGPGSHLEPTGRVTYRCHKAATRWIDCQDGGTIAPLWEPLIADLLSGLFPLGSPCWKTGVTTPMGWWLDEIWRDLKYRPMANGLLAFHFSIRREKGAGAQRLMYCESGKMVEICRNHQKSSNNLFICSSFQF